MGGASFIRHPRAGGVRLGGYRRREGKPPRTALTEKRDTGISSSKLRQRLELEEISIAKNSPKEEMQGGEKSPVVLN